ncbi:metallophosphoesterase, partial [Candidatus Bipolaricaulota bacterium]|nr:metallophosphoesterase [Candidatus Bipolaricaulota bacterium]
MNCRHRRIVAWGIVAVFIIACGALSGQAEAAEGIVFVDANGNGVLDHEEKGLPGVSVSDGITVTQTDAEGNFQIPLRDEARFIFVSTPTGTVAGDNGWYQPVVEGKTDDYNFPLTLHEEDGPLVFIQLSDIHYAPTPEEFKEGLRDRRMTILPDPILAAISDDVNTLEADFVIMTGDLVADAKYPEPARVDEWMASVANFASSLRHSTYGVIGNHDVVRDESIGKTIYESYFGPAYYSFNIKGTHCVVLDTQQLVETKLVYTVDAQQLAWLEQDLATVDPEAPILVFCHEPTPDWAATDESAALFELLASQSITALINGHWHTNTVLQQEPFFELTSGAVCGAFWEGPGPDGSGFGYRVFQMARG